MNRRRFLATAGASSALAAIPLTAAERPVGTRLTRICARRSLDANPSVTPAAWPNGDGFRFAERPQQLQVRPREV